MVCALETVYEGSGQCRGMVGTLLLVDDDQADLVFLEEAARMAAPEIRVVTAREHDAAIAHFDDPSLRLVLLDLNMPGTSGFELLERFRQHERGQDIPILVFTTSAAQADVDVAHDLQANAFVTKPADLHATVEMMKIVLEFWMEHAR